MLFRIDVDQFDYIFVLSKAPREESEMDVMNVYEIKEFKKGVRVSKKVVDEDKAVIYFHFYSTDSKVQLHKHVDAVDVYYVIEGEGKATIGDEEKLLRKGDIVVIPENTIHGVVNPYKKPLIMLDILAPRPKEWASKTSK